jgi:hypothetical protein
MPLPDSYDARGMPEKRPISPEICLEAVRQLTELGKAQFPIVLSDEAPIPKRVAAGLIARALGTADALLFLAPLERAADSTVLARSLYEHAITLAWVTGSEDEAMDRIALLQRDDNEHRGKADREFTDLRGEGILTEGNREAIAQAMKLVGRRKLPPLTERARVADADWGERFGFGSIGNPLASLRAAYTTLYRFATAFAHPTFLGLNPVMERTPAATVIFVEKGDQGAKPMLLVPSLLGIALVIGSDLLGSPRMSEINAIFKSMKASL